MGGDGGCTNYINSQLSECLLRRLRWRGRCQNHTALRLTKTLHLSFPNFTRPFQSSEHTRVPPAPWKMPNPLLAAAPLIPCVSSALCGRMCTHHSAYPFPTDNVGVQTTNGAIGTSEKRAGGCQALLLLCSFRALLILTATLSIPASFSGD